MKIKEVLKINKENLRPARNVDADILAPRLVFIICVLALILFGLVMIFSASNVEALDHNESPFYYLFKQVFFCIVGLAAVYIIWRKIPFSAWKGKLLWVCCGALSLLMFCTLFFGTDILGAKRWLYVGPVSIQPAEYAKIILVLIVAKYYSEYRGGHISFGNCLLIAGGLSGLMLAFIVVGQSDLGTTVVCVVGILSVLWISGFSKWFFGAIVAFFLFLIVAAVVLSGWRSNRFVFLDPWNDGQGGYGAGYQLIRSIYALSEGGILGVGLGNSYEKYQYLPEAETDFIYAIVGEELGMIGCILVLAIFVVFLIAGMKIVTKSKSRFAAAISGSFIVMIVFQALLNIMCVVGLAPITGKPLPFISSGGSSLLATLIMVGFVLAASEAEAMPDEYERRRSQFSASANSSKVGKWEYNEEMIDAEIKRRVNNFRSKAKQGVRTFPKNEIPNNKPVNIKDPKFISENDKKRNAPRPRTNNNVGRPSVNKRKSNVQSLSSKNGSYVYRRTNDEPSFKPRFPKFSNSNMFDKNTRKK